MKITEETRKRLWLLAYASQSFRHARVSCDLLLAGVEGNRDDLYLPLVAAIHVYYHRPVDKNWGAGKLPEELVPPELRPIHDFVSSFRDNVFVHTRASNYEPLGEPINKVFITIDESVVIESVDPRPRIEAYHDVRRLIVEMEKVIHAEIDSFLRAHVDELPSKRGEYLLTLVGDQVFLPQPAA